MKDHIEQLAKLIVDYSKKKRCPDANFINKAIGILVDYCKVKNYLNDAYFADLNGEFLCGYDFYEKRIYVDYNKLISTILQSIDMEKEVGVLSTTDYFYYKMGLFVLDSVAHELFHAKQYKKVDKKQEDLEKELLEISFEGNLLISSANKEGRLLTPDEVYFINQLSKADTNPKYHDTVPSERMAQIDSLRLGSDVSTVIEIPELKDYADLRLEKAKINGYKELDCPSAHILSFHNKLKNSCGLTKDAEEDYNKNVLHFEEQALAMKASDEDRFYYGLLIDEDLYTKEAIKHNALVRKLIEKD